MAASVEVISHWHHSFEDFNTSALEFYRAVEETLKQKEAPSMTASRIDWAESGFLSAKREYLRISHGRFSFDLCAAPFGKDFFFSWWLVKRGPDAAMLFGCLGIIALPIVLFVCIQMAGFFGGMILFLVLLGVSFATLLSSARSGSPVEDMILAIPLVGRFYERFLKPVTYYSIDSRTVFEETVHRVVMNHISSLLTISKLPPLTADELKPQTRKTLP